MGQVGTIARDPAVLNIAIPSTSTITRGMAVTVDSTLKTARVIGATTESLYGYATSDADTDRLQLDVASGKGGFTVWVKGSTGVTFAVGDLVYVNTVALDGTFTNVVGTGVGATKLGYIVDAKADAYGCIEMAFLSA
jgi:hypothetical protein